MTLIEIERIGIDFGTSNTAASVSGVRHGNPIHEIIPLDDRDLLKSLLYFPSPRESYFGKAAIEKYFENEREGRFFQSIKRLLPNPDFSGTQISGRFVSLENLISRFLAEAKKRIEIKFDQSISEKEIVFGRPALYSLDEAREKLATTRFHEAIRLAGFQNYSLLEEPTAASRVAIKKSQGIPTKEKVTLVADLGGGTSDFTVLHQSESGSHRVLAVHGIPLAGDALDSTFVSNRLLPYFGSEVKYQRPFSSNILTFPTSLISRIPKWHQHVILKEKSNWNFLLDLKKELVNPSDKKVLENIITLVDENLGYQLHQSVERLKIAIASSQQDQNEEKNFEFRSYPIDIQFGVQRMQYEEIIHGVAQQITETAAETLRLAGIQPSQIDVLHFTGGTSQVPVLRKSIAAVVPQAVIEDQDSFTSVALGLSLNA